jgi:hypothetical protein
MHQLIMDDGKMNLTNILIYSNAPMQDKFSYAKSPAQR